MLLTPSRRVVLSTFKKERDKTDNIAAAPTRIVKAFEETFFNMPSQTRAGHTVVSGAVSDKVAAILCIVPIQSSKNVNRVNGLYQLPKG